MTTTAHEDQFTDAPELVIKPYDTGSILRRNVADLELALKQQTERAEAADEKLTTAREDMQSWIDSRNGWMERAGAAESELLAVRENNHSMMLEIDGLRKELARLREQIEVEWRPVVGFEGLYEVSSNGDIRNVQTGNIAAKSLMGDGYVKADLWKKGKRKQTSAHRVVAEAFIGGIDGLEINHRNGVKTDNRVSNLEITTRSGNVNHSYYELGHIIKPILATNIATGDTTEYRSIEEAVRIGGFRSSSIYDCLNGKVKTHSGHSFSRPTAPVPATAAPSGWNIRRDGDVLIVQHPDIGGCSVQKEPDWERMIPESILYSLADALLQSTEGRCSQTHNEVRHD